MKIARLRFDRDVPPWGVTGFLDAMTSNHLKLTTISEICWHFADGRFDEDLILAERSVHVFEKIDYDSIEDAGFRILAEKSDDPEKFWNRLNRLSRPVVFRKRRGGKILPLYDLTTDSAFKIRSLSNNSPVEVKVSGLGEAIVDLVYAGEREQRRRVTDALEQVQQAARNYEQIGLASQVVDDPRVPHGVRVYARQGLQQLLRRQGKLNDMVGLQVLGVNQNA